MFVFQIQMSFISWISCAPLVMSIVLVLSALWTLCLLGFAFVACEVGHKGQIEPWGEVRLETGDYFNVIILILMCNNIVFSKHLFWALD